jgi:methylated-DNA-[protein]-cysteine S-methyltransferase
MKKYCEFLSSVIGIIKIMASDDAVLSVSYAESMEQDVPNPVTRACAKQLTEYFSGQRRDFQLKLDPQGTPFQRSVWAVLNRIPYAQTKSYQEIAAAMGNRNLVRAVGQANKNNPIAIIIPCHRVIQKSGGVGGYNGAPWRKEKLIALEAGYKSSAS